MAALPRLLPLVVVVMLLPQLLATSCLTNQDCGSGCCSGYGWCVGARSGQQGGVLIIKGVNKISRFTQYSEIVEVLVEHLLLLAIPSLRI